MTTGYQNLLGIFSWFGYVLPLPERLRLIKAAGFDATTLWWEDEVGIPSIKKEAMPGLVREAGLFLENIHIPYHECDGLWSENRSVREAVLKQYRGWLDDCERYRIPIMVMHISDSLTLPPPNRYGLEGIAGLVKTAEERGITIAIENTGREDYIRFVFSRLESPHLGFCYDSSHHRIYGQGRLDLLASLAARVVCTHLSDNDGRQDCHWLPGEGIIDFRPISALLAAAGYQAALTLEVTRGEQDGATPPAQFLARAFQAAAAIRRTCCADSLDEP